MLWKHIAVIALAMLVWSCASTPPPPPPVKVITKPVRLEVYQPPLPNHIDLIDMNWKVITNVPCRPATGRSKVFGSSKTYYTTDKFQKTEDGLVELTPIRDEFGVVIEVCGNLQQKIAEVEAELNSDFVIFAMVPPDYENFAINMQEIQRYINQQREIILYYREVTSVDDWIEENKQLQTEQLTNEVPK